MRPLHHPKLKLNSLVVCDALSYRYLGVHMDGKLQWNIQAQKAVTKATSWALAFRQLMDVTWRVSAWLMQCLYLAVAIPKMMYSLDTWYVPPHKPDGVQRCIGSVKQLGCCPMDCHTGDHRGKAYNINHPTGHAHRCSANGIDPEDDM